MRFKHKRNPAAKEGDTRIVMKFLWFPMSLGEPFTRWLEWSLVEERVIRKRDGEFVLYGSIWDRGEWVPIKFRDDLLRVKE